MFFTTRRSVRWGEFWINFSARVYAYACILWLRLRENFLFLSSHRETDVYVPFKSHIKLAGPKQTHCVPFPRRPDPARPSRATRLSTLTRITVILLLFLLLLFSLLLYRRLCGQTWEKSYDIFANFTHAYTLPSHLFECEGVSAFSTRSSSFFRGLTGRTRQFESGPYLLYYIGSENHRSPTACWIIYFVCTFSTVRYNILYTIRL